MKILNIIMIAFSGFVLAQSPVKYELINSEINTELSNFGTTFYGSDKVIFSQPKQGGKKWEGNKQPFLDLYIATVDENGVLVDVTAFSSDVNSKYHEASAVFTSDLSKVYFTRNDFHNNKRGKSSVTGKSTQNLYVATKDASGKYGNVKQLPFNSNDYSCGLATLSSDDNTMYFVSDMNNEPGNTDIYSVAVHTDGTYGTPTKVAGVNTASKEMFPYMSKEGVLYFASNRQGGMGNLDVYAYNFNTNKLSHLPAPVNSAGDDFSFVIDNDRKFGFISSNREGGKGDDDIYAFSFRKCKQQLEGIVIDAVSKKPLANVLISISGQEVTTDAVGKYSYASLECNKKYNLRASLTNYEDSYSALTTNKDFDAKLTQNIALVPNAVEVRDDEIMVKINPIYFDLGKSAIRPDAALELDKVVAVMKQYPEIKIEAGSHTDARGKEASNQRLSERRANSTVAYIISKGIAKDRLTAKGYGESQLINKCEDGVECSEEEHQLNRRTEFVITNSNE